jgi:hypothetical protein
MSISAISSARLPAIVSSRMVKPRREESAEFLRSVMDDTDLATDNKLVFYSPEDEQLAADTVTPPGAKTEAERHAEQMARTAFLKKKRRAAQARREAAKSEVLNDMIARRARFKDGFQELRAEDHALDQLVKEEIQEGLLAWQVHGEAFFEAVAAKLVASESAFGDRLELSSPPTDTATVERPSPTSVDGAPRRAESMLNLTA